MYTVQESKYQLFLNVLLYSSTEQALKFKE